VFTESLHDNGHGTDRIENTVFLLLLQLFGRMVFIELLLSNALSKSITILNIFSLLPVLVTAQKRLISKYPSYNNVTESDILLSNSLCVKKPAVLFCVMTK
jgi:hypothetical protein